MSLSSLLVAHRVSISDKNVLKISYLLRNAFRDWLLYENHVFTSIIIPSFEIFTAIQWILREGEMVLPTSMLTVVRGILSHMNGCTSKTNFIHSLLKGSGANLSSTSRDALAKMVK